MRGDDADVEVLMTACQEVTLNQREQTEQRQAQEGARREAGAKTTGRLMNRILCQRSPCQSTEHNRRGRYGQIFCSGLNGAQLALLHAPTLGSVGNGGEGGCGGGGSSGGDGCGGGRPSAVTTAAAAGDSAAAAASPSLVLR